MREVALVGLVIAVVAGSLILVVGSFGVLVEGLVQWHRNNRSSPVTSPATLVAKHQEGSDPRPLGTLYYLTFRFDSGDEVETLVAESVWRRLTVGDRGRLTLRGTRYWAFDRSTGHPGPR
ncbi:DUF2500 domain-containing protein [Spongisporangium articulatum]|uniref:DUF2500 domain-containing protein n=1 Tax=Spongisporangium articulatum TaxID=3362603 RepID=A0ABW8ARG2_9ACTN